MSMSFLSTWMIRTRIICRIPSVQRSWLTSLFFCVPYSSTYIFKRSSIGWSLVQCLFLYILHHHVYIRGNRTLSQVTVVTSRKLPERLFLCGFWIRKRLPNSRYSLRDIVCGTEIRTIAPARPSTYIQYDNDSRLQWSSSKIGSYFSSPSVIGSHKSGSETW